MHDLARAAEAPPVGQDQSGPFPRAAQAALRQFERHVLDAEALDRAGLGRLWEGLRRGLGALHLELRAPASGSPLAAPRELARRIDEPWLTGLGPGAVAELPAGGGRLGALGARAVAVADGVARLVAVFEPDTALGALPLGALAGPLREALQAGRAALRVAAATEERGRQEALARLGARAGGRLHDLRNQLTLALFRADEVLQAGATNPGSVAGDESRRAKAAAALVEDLRRARELAADGISLQRSADDGLGGHRGDDVRGLRRVPLRALLLEEARALAATARAAGARVRARCSAEIEVLGDSTVLGRLVRNLLLNAAESRPGGAALTVDVARLPGARVALWIEDDGLGMDTEALAGYLDAGRSTGGTGFGTASVREALERLDGRIEVASARGQGTRVRLELWCAPPAGGETVLVVTPTVEPGSAAPGHVMVACPLRALALLEGLAPARVELHRAALGPGRRQLVRAAARVGVPVVSRSAREWVAL